MPSSRLRVLTDAPPNPKGSYVLYWMIAHRRPRRNFALQRAVEWSRSLSRPLLVLEPLRCGYEWASERLHRFVLDGMAANAAYFSSTTATYYPYLEPEPGAGRELLAQLAERAAVVVTDDHPGFFYPRMLAAAAAQVRVRFEAVDANGLLPLSAAGGRAFTTAHSFRRFLQNELDAQLSRRPQEEPLLGLDLPPLRSLPAALRLRYPALTHAQLCKPARALAAIPVDSSVGAVPREGGWLAALWRLHEFVKCRLPAYANGRNHPDSHATSNLSPYLHFGHISTDDVLAAVTEAENWRGPSESHPKDGSREGFWGTSENGEAFLEQVITWRELALNTAANLAHYEAYDSLPPWARASLDAGASDPRPYCYELPQLEAAETHDPVWNAAQTELVREGSMHNYMRMLWGKKILEWSPSPRAALKAMTHLNNKYALDGRDPNSQAGIMWTLGRYDRPWAPRRPIFGVVRYMSSDSARRKLDLDAYLQTFGPTPSRGVDETAQ